MKARVKTLLVLLLIFCLMLPGCESLGGNGGSSLPEISYEVPSKPEKEESSKTEASANPLRLRIPKEVRALRATNRKKAA